MLTVNPAADLMCGNFTVRDENGALAFEKWILAKKDGSSEKIVGGLRLGQLAK